MERRHGGGLSMTGRRRAAVVLFNLGGPDSLKAVRPFLFNLFRDPAIIQAPAPVRYPLAALISGTRARAARENYAHMGGASPLLRETAAQAQALQAELDRRLPDREARVFTAMRYWRPFTDEAARAVEAFGPDEVVLLPLYPQFSTTTTGSSLKAWRSAYRGRGEVRAVCCYYDHEALIDAHVRRIRACWAAAGRPQGVRVLFSAHGLPERCIQAGDPYQWQVEATCRAIAEKLQWQWDWRICYQSRVGPLKWIGPYTTEAIAEACHDGMGVLVDPVAFVSEHIETLVELDRDYLKFAEDAGCSVYLRAHAVGTDEGFISGLAELAAGALQGPEIQSASPACDGACRKCPRRAGIHLRRAA
jgi:ferrochelatase